jgi:hypothetical protein
MTTNIIGTRITAIIRMTVMTRIESSDEDDKMITKTLKATVTRNHNNPSKRNNDRNDFFLKYFLFDTYFCSWSMSTTTFSRGSTAYRYMSVLKQNRLLKIDFFCIEHKLTRCCQLGCVRNAVPACGCVCRIRSHCTKPCRNEHAFLSNTINYYY